MLNIIDEFTGEALAIRVDRKLNSTDVADALTDLCAPCVQRLCPDAPAYRDRWKTGATIRASAVAK